MVDVLEINTDSTVQIVTRKVPLSKIRFPQNPHSHFFLNLLNDVHFSMKQQCTKIMLATERNNFIEGFTSTIKHSYN